jgi:hypothetical protein
MENPAVMSRTWILIALVACGSVSLRGNEWWSLDRPTWLLSNPTVDAACDSCDSVSELAWSGEAVCDDACDAARCSTQNPCFTQNQCSCGKNSRLVEGRDVPLPMHLGSGVVFTEMDRNVAVSDVRLALGDDLPTSAERVSVPTSKFHASSQLARLDLWVLPCLNLYGIVGHTRSTGDITVTVDRFPLPTSPPVDLRIPVDLRGATAGWGMTTGIGAKSWFAMLDINKTWTDFSNLDSSLTALVIAPRVGVPINRPCLKGEMHLGAMWQDTAQTVNLTVNHPVLGDGLQVEVDQFEPRPWNFLVGGLWAINERFMVMIEGGMGGRSYVISGITLRH